VANSPLNLVPLQWKDVRIDFPVALAAMSGYSDWPTRTIARRMGAGYSICEVLLDQFVVNVTKGKKALRWIRVADDDHPVGAQLMGGAGGPFVPAALKLVEAGFDVIDVNFGCPVRKVVGKCRGGWMLSQPEKALEILARLRDALPPRVPLTLKMRRGLDDSPQSRDNFFAIFDGARALGVSAVTVHGRTVRQRYEGRSSWEFVREVKDRAGAAPVLGSGDLFTASDGLAMFAATGVDGITIARGAIGNPWIFRDIRALVAGRPLPPPPSLAEQRAVIEEHHRLAQTVYGAKRAVFVMRNFGIKYSRMHPQPDRVRDAFAAIRQPDQWKQTLTRWYAY
jgi:nifR3 family TIM-barrel protein